jgi:hypothetical protein
VLSRSADRRGGIAIPHGSGLRYAVARRRGQAIADGVGADDEVTIGIERPAGSDQKVQPMMR